MSTRCLAFLLAFGLADLIAAAPPGDFEKIQGVWQAASIEADGKVDPGAALDNARFVFERNLVTIYQANKRIGSYRFSLQPKKPVAAIDFASPKNPTPDTSRHGIYRFAGEKLELCLGNSRPKEFRGENGAEFLVFKRPEPEKTVPVPGWCLDVSPDGQFLAMAGGRRNARGVVELLNAKDWSVALTHTEQRAATCVAFSPDGKKLAIGTQIGEVAIYDLELRTVEERWHTGKWAVFGICWTPDNREVVAACANGLLKRFCADCGGLRTNYDTWLADDTANQKLGGHEDRNLWDATVSRDGNIMLSGGWNGTTRIWNLTTGGMIQAFPDEERSTQGVKFTPDERHIVSNGLFSQAVIVRTADGYMVRAKLDAKGRDVAVHPDGKLIAAATLENVKLFRLDLSEPSPDQKAGFRKLADQLADADEKVRTAAKEKLKEIGLPADAILEEVSQTARGEHLERIKQLREEIQSPDPIAIIAENQGEIRQVVISPKGNFLATSANSGDIRIWNPETFELQYQWRLKASP